MTAQSDRLLSALVRRIDADYTGDADPEVENARRYLASKRAVRQRIAAKRAPRVESEAQAAAREDQRHRDFVARVMIRDALTCQLCGGDGNRETNPLDPHHLEPGRNKQKHEKLSNTLTAHRSCHDDAHAHEAKYVPAVKAWAAKHGYPLPARKVYR